MAEIFFSQFIVQSEEVAEPSHDAEVLLFEERHVGAGGDAVGYVRPHPVADLLRFRYGDIEELVGVVRFDLRETVRELGVGRIGMYRGSYIFHGRRVVRVGAADGDRLHFGSAVGYFQPAGKIAVEHVGVVVVKRSRCVLEPKNHNEPPIKRGVLSRFVHRNRRLPTCTADTNSSSSLFFMSTFSNNGGGSMLSAMVWRFGRSFFFMWLADSTQVCYRWSFLVRYQAGTNDKTDSGGGGNSIGRKANYHPPPAIL